MTKALHPQKKTNTKIDYTTIADRLYAISWSNDSCPIGVVKPVYGNPTFLLTPMAV